MSGGKCAQLSWLQIMFTMSDVIFSYVKLKILVRKYLRKNPYLSLWSGDMQIRFLLGAKGFGLWNFLNLRIVANYREPWFGSLALDNHGQNIQLEYPRKKFKIKKYVIKCSKFLQSFI